MQDEVLEQHLKSSDFLRRVFRFLSETLWLNARILTTARFTEEKQTAIRRLAVDSLSHTIVAVRLGLWGDLPESLTMLRSALESGTQLRFVVSEQKYKTFIYEMDRKFDKVSFENSLRGLGELGRRTETIHGRISGIAAHATTKRMALVGYEYNGEFYDRVGFARNTQNAELALFYCMDASLMVAQALFFAYEQESLSFPCAQEMDRLNSEFELLRAEYKRNFSRDSG